MHQPFYKNLVTGEYHLPWTRLHALKDYYGMVKVLEDFPAIHQTFNLVPSMMLQIQEYAQGAAADPFLRLALKPAEELTEDEQSFVLRYFFQANVEHLVRRFPRYGELYDAWIASEKNPSRARPFFPPSTLRDLQVLSQLAWFDEEFLANDTEAIELVRKSRDYSHDDQDLMGCKQLEILNRIVPVYRDFAARGQIEISTTPFYHPILPLLCDTDIAQVAHPGAPLPTPFRYPEDARHQIERARDYVVSLLGRPPAGLWPSEGSVSDAALTIVAEAGFQWAATDNGVLSQTLGHTADTTHTYRSYVWRQSGRELKLLFRDHYLSDLVGFVYSRMQPREAAAHLMDRIIENTAGILAEGRDALVPIILDGENAWEHYPLNGRPFLQDLYGRLSEDPRIEALTVSEALERTEPLPLDRIHPGSWINANFDVWIGYEEDNRAWELLLAARRTYDEAATAGPIPEDRRKVAWEELLIAEGSDWCWWYGPQHWSENREEFDQLYRAHLANVYQALDREVPAELGRPILRVEAAEFHEGPTEPISPTIDGQVTSYFEWMAAGHYRVDERSGAMHGNRPLIAGMHYGRDAANLYLRFDFRDNPEGTRLELTLESGSRSIYITRGAAQAEAPLEAAFDTILEVRVPLPAFGGGAHDAVRLQVSVWRDALPLDALPPSGWLAI